MKNDSRHQRRWLRWTLGKVLPPKWKASPQSHKQELLGALRSPLSEIVTLLIKTDHVSLNSSASKEHSNTKANSELFKEQTDKLLSLALKKFQKTPNVENPTSFDLLLTTMACRESEKLQKNQAPELLHDSLSAALIDGAAMLVEGLEVETQLALSLFFEGLNCEEIALICNKTADEVEEMIAAGKASLLSELKEAQTI